MGKPPFTFTDSETEDTNSCSSIDKKKKKKFSILKYTTGNVKKKKCELHSKSEPSDSDYRSKSSRSRSNQRVRYKLPGILKNANNHTESSDEDEDSEPLKPRVHGKFLVGRVPRPAGAKPGRGGGVAIIVRKNVSLAEIGASSRNEAQTMLADDIEMFATMDITVIGRFKQNFIFLSGF